MKVINKPWKCDKTKEPNWGALYEQRTIKQWATAEAETGWEQLTQSESKMRVLDEANKAIFSKTRDNKADLH